MTGKLFIVATPIGNLKDITLRAIETLQQVDLIAAEDTRHSQILCKEYEIKTKLESFHSHSSSAKTNKIIEQILNGKDVALISDAGTPGISDPGYVLIKSALENEIEIVPIPGVSACITALSASGLPTDKYLYLGFLPIKKGRQTLFQSLLEEKRTTVFYESPHRLIKTLTQLNEIMPERKIVIARELTKIYEEFFRGDVSQALEKFETQKPKGEFTIILGGA